MASQKAAKKKQTSTRATNQLKKRKKKKSSEHITPAQRRQLQRIYYNVNHPAGYASVQKVIASSGLPPRIVKAWLEEQPTYTLHRPRSKRILVHYPYRVYAPRIQYQADLVDYTKYSKWNKNYKFMLVVIDVFSKYAWAVPLKSKSGAEVAKQLETILNPPPERLQVDQGKEFYNMSVTRVIDELGVERFSIDSPYKCAVVERLNRTIKNKLEQHFTATNSKDWLSVLPQVISTYNNTVHRTIGMKPIDVDEGSIEEALERTLKIQRQNQKRRYRKKEIETFPINSRVRISRDKGTFGRGYEANWSTEEFFVHEVRKTPGGPYMYKLRDAAGDVLKGSFYPEEVQRVRRNQEIYQIDAIEDERTRNGKKEVLIHWQGYPASMNEWIPASRLQKLTKFRKY